MRRLTKRDLCQCENSRYHLDHSKFDGDHTCCDICDKSIGGSVAVLNILGWRADKETVYCPKCVKDFLKSSKESAESATNVV